MTTRALFISEDEDVLLFLDRRRTYLIKARRGEALHTHKGVVQLDEIIGKRYGEKISSNIGYEFVMLKPTIYDYLKKMSRPTQIVYQKDIAIILSYLGIGRGSRVVEAGTGSGALTSVLAHQVQPGGMVYSYEIREEFMEKARKNLTRVGFLDFVELKNRDVIQGIDERDVDAVFLDMATPWLVVPKAYKALKGSGNLVSFSPTVEQTVKSVKALADNCFVDIETVECIIRRMKVKEGETRPETLMRGHTGYITRARKAMC